MTMTVLIALSTPSMGTDTRLALVSLSMNMESVLTGNKKSMVLIAELLETMKSSLVVSIVSVDSFVNNSWAISIAKFVSS